MIVKNNIIFHTVLNDREYSFSFPVGAPIGEIHDALYQMVKETLDVAAKAAESIKNMGDENGS